MHHTVRIEPGYHIIDAGAWVHQRTNEPHADLTAALNEFTHHPVVGQYHPQMDTSARMQLWCAARGWSTTSEETSHYHDHTCMSEPVSIVLAVDGDRSAYALVQVGIDAPDVYLDLTTDDAYWLQVEPVDILCPAGRASLELAGPHQPARRGRPLPPVHRPVRPCAWRTVRRMPRLPRLRRRATRTAVPLR